MMKKSLILFCLALLCSIFSYAQKDVSWLRYPQISPDGKSVAFSYKGDVYVVDATGGKANQITSNAAYDYNPKWSPDGNFIAFNSNRYGSQDVFIVSAQGGMPTRLTTNSANETLQCFSPDGKEVYYTAYIQHPANYAQFPATYLSQLYKVSVEGGRPFQVLPNAVANVCFSKSGKNILYEDVKGQENAWRKHHTSAVARDIWSYNFDTQSFEQLTNAPAEDRNPVYDSKEQNIYFLSERNGSFNVFYGKTNQLNKAKQITNFTKNPVRFLSASNNETLCFGFNGKIYIKAKDKDAFALKIDIFSDAENPVNTYTKSSGASEAAFSPNGKEVALVVEGDIYVTSVEYGTTKQITNTAGIERSISWSSDGKSIVYAAERNGNWNICMSINGDSKEPYLYCSNKIVEVVLVDGETADFQPEFSPNGKEVAFLRDRTKLCIVDVSSKQVRQITDGSRNFSYSDGDQTFAWSPDSKWLVLTYMGSTRHPYNDIGIISAKGGEIHNLTMSGYMDGNPKFAMKGNVVIFASDRYGMRSHASWGSQEDVFAVFLNKKSFADFNLSKEEAELAKEREKLSDEALNKDKKKDTTSVQKDVEIDFNGIENRIKRLTINSSDLAGFALTDDGSKLFYLVSIEKGYDLWQHDFKENETKLLEKLGTGAASLELDSKGEKLLVVSSKGIFTLDVKNTKTKKNVTFKAEVDANSQAKRLAMFEHVKNTVAAKFYNKNLHNIDWKDYCAHYQQFLPYIDNYYDFSELLSELLGELNASHTGSGYRSSSSNLKTTAKIGLLFDLYKKEKGLKVEEVLLGGIFDKADTKVKANCYLTKIDGVEINENTDFFELLNGKAGDEIVVTFKNGNEEFTEKIKPVSSENEVLYDRWIENERAKVEKLSNGKLGYAHIRSMDDASYRSVYSDILGRYNDKEGIVIDTRFNGGGRLHEDVEVLLGGKKYLEQVPRGQKVNEQPTKRWLKPSILIQGEANYSNAHGTPWVYREMGLGKLVGMPVPGTMTSVWWENLPESGLYYGIPIAGYIDRNNKFLENEQLEPDIKVANESNILWQNRDQQIEEAVKILLQDVKNFKDPWKSLQY